MSSGNLIDIPIAFLGGVLTFIAPCIFLSILAYLLFSFGLASDSAQVNKKLNYKIILFYCFLVILGLVAIFLIDTFPSSVQHFMGYRRNYLTKIASLIMIVFGLGLMGTWRFPKLKSDDSTTFWQPYFFVLFGAALGVAWLHCLTPILAYILGPMARDNSLVYKGLLLLVVYAMGLGLTLLISSLLITKIVSYFSYKLQKKTKTISGIFLVLFGTALFINPLWVWLNKYFISLTSTSLSNRIEILILNIVK